MTFRPLLAAPVDFNRLDYADLYLSPKLDGIRAIVIDGVVMSRSLKPIPNQHVQNLFKHLEFFDGELICGSPTSPSCYRDTNSAVMSRDGEPDVTFYVFDHIENPDDDYLDRYEKLTWPVGVALLPQHRVRHVVEVEGLENSYLEEGFEGVMLRKGRGPNSKYKFGRATAKSNTLLKVKRFVDAEFRVVGFEERMHNANVATTDELGRTKRSSHQENKVGRDDLGALILASDAGTFNCGTGFTDADRAEIWANRGSYIGKLAKVKHFEVGAKTLPRFPVFLGWRSEEDL